MNKLDAIVIGSGLGGLIAGAKLIKEGRKVVLLEQHYIPGGCATTFKRKDFVFEVGLHEMDGLDKDDPKHKLFEELEIFENIELKKVPEFYRVHSTGSQNDINFILPDNIEEAKKLLIRTFPKEKKGINKFFKTILGIRNKINFWKKLKSWQKKVLFPIFPIIWLIIFQKKGKVILGKRVTSIITEGDKAIGVKFQNTYDKNSKEEELFANVIIANAAIPNILEMLNSENKEKLQQQTHSLKHSCSLLSIYVGFKKNLSKDF